MWVGVTPRFTRFEAAITPSADQIGDGVRSTEGIAGSLDRAYRGQAMKNTWFFAGSWGKGTARVPFNDADVFYLLPYEVYERVQQLAGNRQSQLLQQVKNVLLNTYPQTDMRGDGQVVQVRFNHLLVEVVPAFLLQDGRYAICDTNDGGRWQVADPRREIAAVELADFASNANARRIIRMAKSWKDECGVPLKSYVLETLVADFMKVCAWRDKDHYYYDWIFRDFFGSLIGRRNMNLQVPDGSVVPLGEAWFTRAQSAYTRSLRACELEREDRTAEAGEEWQKIFGYKIPIHV